MKNSLNIEEEAKFEKEVYSNRAQVTLEMALYVLIFNMVTYVLFGLSEVGLIFELITLIFVILAIKKLKIQLVRKAKENTIIAMFPICCLLIYDFVDLLLNLKQIMQEINEYYTSMQIFFYRYTLDIVDITLIIILVFLVISYKNLKKANKEEI